MGFFDGVSADKGESGFVDEGIGILVSFFERRGDRIRIGLLEVAFIAVKLPGFLVKSSPSSESFAAFERRERRKGCSHLKCERALLGPR